MSLIQELGAQLRAASDELPAGQVRVALEKLRGAADLLTWVRQASVDPIGVPLLSNATEHAERAAAALRVAQDAIAAYLTEIGLTGEAAGRPDGESRRPVEQVEPPKTRVRPVRPGSGAQSPPEPEKLGPWWRQRVTELTGEPPPPPEEVARKHPSTAELLRRVAADVRTGDRARLGRDLHHVDAATGLGLSAVTPPVLHRLAGALLGHEPRPEDVNRLRTAVGGRVRSLLPGTDPGLLETLLARICGAPARTGQQPGHPADTAVTAGVLTGVLLARLGRDPATLPATPEPPGSSAPPEGPGAGTHPASLPGADA